MHFMRRICHMYKYVQFLESNKQNNNKKRISKNPIVIYFQQPLVKSENCTVKITFEPLKLYRQSFILYLLRLSVILRPLSFLLISSPDVSAFGSFVSHINTTTTTNHHMNCLPYKFTGWQQGLVYFPTKHKIIIEFSTAHIYEHLIYILHTPEIKTPRSQIIVRVTTV